MQSIYISEGHEVRPFACACGDAEWLGCVDILTPGTSTRTHVLPFRFATEAKAIDAAQRWAGSRYPDSPDLPTKIMSQSSMPGSWGSASLNDLSLPREESLGFETICTMYLLSPSDFSVEVKQSGPWIAGRTTGRVVSVRRIATWATKEFAAGPRHAWVSDFADQLEAGFFHLPGTP